MDDFASFRIQAGAGKSLALRSLEILLDWQRRGVAGVFASRRLRGPLFENSSHGLPSEKDLMPRGPE